MNLYPRIINLRSQLVNNKLYYTIAIPDALVKWFIDVDKKLLLEPQIKDGVKSLRLTFVD